MAFPGLSLVGHVEVLHGADADVVNDQAPDVGFGTAIAPVHEIAMLRLSDGPALQHIVQLGTDPMVVLAREPGPESFLLWFQSAFHLVYLRCPSRGGPDTASLVGRCEALKNC